MIDTTEFVALSDDQAGAIEGGGPLFDLFKIGITLVAGEIIKNWSPFTAGISQGAAAAAQW